MNALTAATYLRRQGYSYAPGPLEEVCSECRGAGLFYSDNGPAPRETECEDCCGRGFVEAECDDARIARVVARMRAEVRV